MKLASVVLFCSFSLWSLALGASRDQSTAWAVNLSFEESCAEIDNVIVALYAGFGISEFTITATHPRYWIEPSDFPCFPDWRNCRVDVDGTVPDSCEKIWDDGETVLEVCRAESWWRGPEGEMGVEVRGKQMQGHYLRVYRKVADSPSWPQVLVLYADGNIRLKPQPPAHMPDVCFGSSVVVGPVTLGERPFADVRHVSFDPGTSTLDVMYRNGEHATLTMTTNRARTQVVVKIGYNTDSEHPFAVFRSMFVKYGNADVDSVAVGDLSVPILGGWTELPGTSWFFHRKVRSTHNPSAPDIAITLRQETTWCPVQVELELPRDVLVVYEATLNGFRGMLNRETAFPVDRVDARDLAVITAGFSMTEVALALLSLVCERDTLALRAPTTAARDFHGEALRILERAASLPRPEVTRALASGETVRARFFHSFYIPLQDVYVPGPGLGTLDNANLAVALAVMSEAFRGTPVAEAASALLKEMDFRFFLTADETGLSLGYLPRSKEYEKAVIGQWGSEGILAVLLAVAKDGADRRCLLRLAQASPLVEWHLAGASGRTIPGYAGGMWVRLFPLLLLGSEELDPRFMEDARHYVRAHIHKAQELCIPFWGWSPCSLVVGDYGEFGVAEIAQFGLPATELVTPYASFLVLGALAGYPGASEEIVAGWRNLTALATVPCAFDLSRGFVDCVDPVSRAVGPSLLSLDKGMEVVSLSNYLLRTSGLPGLGAYLWSYFRTIGVEACIKGLLRDAGDIFFGRE